jgi:hypothetical protein
MEKAQPVNPDLAREKLAGELADVEASIAMVASGVASNMTLTGLRFGQQVAERLTASAASRGVELEASFWPDDTLADIHLTRSIRPGQVDRG